MKRKIFAALIAVIMVVTMLPLSVMAENVICSVTDEATLKTALADSSVSVVKLVNSITVAEPVVVERDVTIDLNTYTLSSAVSNGAAATLWIQAGTVTVNNGTIEYTGSAAPAVRVGISNLENDADPIKLTLSANVTVDSSIWGVVVVAGTLNTFADINAGTAISGNGNVYNTGTVINVMGGTLTATSTAIYHPQEGKLNISNATVKGTEAVGIKAGQLRIQNAELIATGEYNESPAINNNGINETGSVIAVETNSAYKGNVEITIEGSNTVLTSTNGHIIHEYPKNTASSETSAITALKITDGEFVSGKDALRLVESEKKVAVQGGEFGDTSVNSYIKTYGVEYDLNGGHIVSGSEEGKTVTTTKTYGELPVAARNGYVFKGWVVREVWFSEFRDHPVDENSTVDITDNMVRRADGKEYICLMATWEQKEEKPAPKFDMPKLNLRSIVIDTTEGGKTSVASGRCYGALGSTHRLTLTPDEGYEIGEVLVNGKPVEANKNGKISFVVKGNTYVEVEFVEIEG